MSFQNIFLTHIHYYSQFPPTFYPQNPHELPECGTLYPRLYLWFMFTPMNSMYQPQLQYVTYRLQPQIPMFSRCPQFLPVKIVKTPIFPIIFHNFPSFSIIFPIIFHHFPIISHPFPMEIPHFFRLNALPLRPRRWASPPSSPAAPGRRPHARRSAGRRWRASGRVRRDGCTWGN